MLTDAQLAAIFRHLSPQRRAQYLPLLVAALAEFEVSTLARVAAFLAQVGHESGELRWWTEFSSGLQYEGRADLGNFHPGDGVKYKGRSPIMLTGLKNYALAGIELGLDLQNQPALAALPEHGFRIACWWWKDNGLNELADAAVDAAGFDAVTRRVNGGLNGKPQRDALWVIAKRVLGVPQVIASSGPVA